MQSERPPEGSVRPVPRVDDHEEVQTRQQQQTSTTCEARAEQRDGRTETCGRRPAPATLMKARARAFAGRPIRRHAESPPAPGGATCDATGEGGPRAARRGAPRRSSTPG
jgi:hypothetical protein